MYYVIELQKLAQLNAYAKSYSSIFSEIMTHNIFYKYHNTVPHQTINYSCSDV